MNPFGEPGCTCVGPAEIMSAALDQREVDFCELHQRAEIIERSAQEARRAEADHRALRDHARAELDRVVGGPVEEAAPSCSCNLSDVMAAIAGTEIPVCAVHRPAASALPLGSDELTATAAGMFGASIHNTDDLPPAA